MPVDARIERGRSYRHALRRLLEHERFDRVVVSATATGASASPADLVWLLEQGPAEVLILRRARSAWPRVSVAAAPQKLPL